MDGSGLVRHRIAFVPARRHCERGRLACSRPVDGRHAADHLQRRPPGPDHASPAGRSPKRHQGRHRHLSPGSLDDEPRHMESGRALRLVHRRDPGERGHAEPFQRRYQVWEMRRRKQRHPRRMRRHGAGLEGHLAATRRGDRPVWRRTNGHQGQRRQVRRGPADCRGQRCQPGNGARPDRYTTLERPRWQRPAARCRRQHPVQRAQRVDPDSDVRTERLDDDDRSGRLERLGKARLQHGIQCRRPASNRRTHVDQRRLLSPLLRQPDLHRRSSLRREQLRFVLPQGARRS